VIRWMTMCLLPPAASASIREPHYRPASSYHRDLIWPPDSSIEGDSRSEGQVQPERRKKILFL
jgi:hypothetical protein